MSHELGVWASGFIMGAATMLLVAALRDMRRSRRWAKRNGRDRVFVVQRGDGPLTAEVLAEAREALAAGDRMIDELEAADRRDREDLN